MRGDLKYCHFNDRAHVNLSSVGMKTIHKVFSFNQNEIDNYVGLLPSNTSTKAKSTVPRIVHKIVIFPYSSTRYRLKEDALISRCFHFIQKDIDGHIAFKYITRKKYVQQMHALKMLQLNTDWAMPFE